jgi:peptidoglycan/LPS O-acetylase OafA/YrhL
MPAALTEKFDNINLLRAFAALVVVVYHVIEHGHWEAFPAQGPLAVFRIGWIGVDIFFAISGFVIVYSALHLYRRSPPGFQAAYWARRISRIVPLYLLTLSLWVACEPGFFERAGAWWQIVAHLLFVHNWFEGTHGAIDGVNWTLGVEMQFYVLVALLVRWIDRAPGWRILLWCVVVSWAWRACMYALYAGDTSKLFLTTTQLPGALDEFGVGIFLAKRLLDGRLRMPRPRIAWPLLAVATGWIAMTLYWQHAGYWMFPGIVLFWRSAFAVFLLCLLAAAVSLPQVIAYKWLRPIDHLGEVSYGIYLWHLFAIQYAIYAAGYRGIEALAWVVALTVLAASLSWRYFERPLMRLARR